MVNHTIPLEKTGSFSGLFLDYLKGNESLSPFYHLFPSLENFEKQIQKKSESYTYREVLVEVLKEQNKSLALHPAQEQNLLYLKKANSFTITTGHQLCLATGPLYFLYKILTTVKLSEKLKEQYPAYQFVPVFWMASEDHDFEEVNHFYLFGKKYEWQKEASGAVGKLSLEEIENVLGQVADVPLWLKEAYTSSINFAEATRKIVQHLFSEYGVLVLDGDDARLKALLKPIIERDILESKYAPVIRSTSERLQGVGYKSQAFIRDQNFFLLGENSRNRIERQENQFAIVHAEQRLSEQEIKKRIENTPEAFSPNVLMRPLYQEMVLPNLAYIGGPGELAYWLQLKDLFELENIPFPILFPRQFVALLSSNSEKKLQENQIQLNDLFLEEQGFHKLLLEKLNIEKFDFSDDENFFSQLKRSMLDKASKADKTLVPAAEAEMTRITKSLSDLQKRLDKALENKHQADLSKFMNIRKKLFPEGELQERHDNFLNFYINKPTFVKDLYPLLDPFEFAMNMVLY